MIPTSDFNRSLSGIFSNPVFKQVAVTGTSEYFLSKLKKYNCELSINNNGRVKDIIETAYSYLGKNYRNEYVYKNTIVNNILLGRHSLKTATLLNEFRIGNSIADTVIINGSSTVYEIKTELDSSEKLRKQIDDYKKAFGKIYLVTHHSLTNKYLKIIEAGEVGILSLSDRFSLSQVKDAGEDFSGLQNDYMMKSLRKIEYSAILKNIFGTVPRVSNIRFFSECLQWAREIEPLEFHKQMQVQLKKRIPSEQGQLQSETLPRELKHICLCINPSQKEYNNLFHFLNLNP